MADLTLPGTIPGLLRRGSPVVFVRGSAYAAYSGGRGMLIHPSEPARGSMPYSFGWPVAMCDTTHDRVCYAEGTDIALDLSDPTGLIHAVWWMASLDEQRFPAAVLALGLYGPAFDVAFEQALIGRPLDEREIGMIRRVGLYLAGVSDAD